MTDAPLIHVPENPIPDGLTVRFVEASDGARLRVAFLPTENARGTVLVHPGWSEFLEKYLEVATDLRARGFNVVINDPRGQGYSQKLMAGDERGLIRDYTVFEDDLETVYREAQSVFGGPYFLLAHSMGGLVSLGWLARGGGADLTGVTLVAPLTRLFASIPQRVIVHAITRAWVAAGQGARHLYAAPEHSMNFETNTLTQDRQRHERFKQLQMTAPDAVAGSPRFAWLNAGMAAMGKINRRGALSEIKKRILLVSAKNDVTVDPTNHARLANAYPDLFDYVPIENARHEVLMEVDELRDQFWTAFDRYVSAQLASGDRVKVPPSASSASPDKIMSNNTSAT